MGGEVLVRATGVHKTFRTAAGAVQALRGVDLEIRRGEVFALVGESGSGKTVLGEILAGLERPTAGSAACGGRVQMIFQNPFESFNPRLTLGASVAEPLRSLERGRRAGRDERGERALRALKEVGLSPAATFAARYPHQCSGGELQRVAIARALVGQPDLLIADEPTTMLDVSIRAAILQLLLRLRDGHGLTILLISHDFSGVSSVSDDVAVMYRGRIVEQGSCERVLLGALHPYTEALLAAIPSPDPDRPLQPAAPAGRAAGGVDGCRFAPRCPYRIDACSEQDPGLRELHPGHRAACLVRERELRGRAQEG